MKNIFKFLMGLLLPTVAMAQSTVFAPATNDISVKVLNQLFGSLVNGGNDAFGGAIATFNGAVLMIGGILATYTILAGTLGTAHDGEMLGKKFSSAWIPIRYSLGTALVLPVLSGGYCVMQQLVMWLVMQGIGLADSVWGSYMQTPGVAANLTINANTTTSIRLLAENAFMAQLCVQANAASIGKSDNILTFANRYNYAMSYDAAKRVYNFGDQKGLFSTFTKSNCGQVTLADAIPNSTVASGPASTNNGYLGPLDNLFSPTDISSINTAQETATQTLINSMGTLATNVVADDSIDATKASTYYGQIDSAVTAYLTTIQGAAQAVAMSPSASTTSAQQYGWMLAGAYFMNTIVTNNKITGAIAAIPDSSFSKSQPMSGAKESFANGFKVLAAGNPIYGSAGDAVKAEGKSEDAKEDSQLGFGGPMINAITRGLTTIDLYQLKNDPRHPVIIINEMGRRLQAYWVGMIIALIAVVGAATVAALIKSSIATSVTNFLLIIVGFLGIPIMALGATSFMASYLIPMLPFMMWLGVVGGWLIAVTIGILAAPLWAVMHLHPNGDDLTGRGGNGYMMVLGLLLRPALAIFGFIFAITMSSVMGEFINKVYFMVFSFSQGDGKGLGFFIGMIAGTAIYCAIMFSFIKKCFSMMHVIPDEMLKWIGGGSDNLGHYAGKMGEGSQGAVSAVAGFTAGRGLSQGMQNTGRQLGDVGNSIKSAKESKVKEGEDNKLKSFGKMKAMSEMKDSIDKNFEGSGVDNAGERLAASMGINEDNIDSADSKQKSFALANAISMVSAHGPEAQEAFVSQMEKGGPDHIGFSSPSEAATFHAQNIASNSTLNNAKSQFGESAGSYLQAVAPNAEGNGLDLKRANKAMDVLSNASAALGSGLENVVKEAVDTHGNDGSAMTSFIKNAAVITALDSKASEPVAPIGDTQNPD